MTFKEKLKLFIHDMKLHKQNNYFTTPPLYKVMWKLGLKCKPPIFNSLNFNVFVYGLRFGCIALLANLLTDLLNLSDYKPSIFQIIFTCLVCGIIFGYLFASSAQKLNKKLNLPLWSNYKGIPNVSSEK
jgi:hypothetical protein